MCDSDSLEFLAGNEMDFSRAFKYGVTSRRLSEKKDVIEEITATLTQKNVLEFEFLSPEDEKIFGEVEANLLDMYKSGKEAVVNFHSKTILTYCQKKHNFIIGDKSKKPELKEFEHLVKAPKGYKLVPKKE